MTALTKNEIFEAANKVARTGKIPSILAVRKELGDRGSESTLQKHLKEWKQNLLQSGQSGCVFCSELELYRSTLNYFKDELREMLQKD